MQFNLVNDQEQVAQFVRRGMAWYCGIALHCMALAKGFISIWGGGSCSVCSVGVY